MTSLFQEIIRGDELKYVVDIVSQKDDSSSGDLFYDLQNLHTQVSELSEDEIHRLCDYVDTKMLS